MKELVRPLPGGHRLDEYRILRTLGLGGFGTTYLCRDENLQKRTVIKEFTPHALVARQLDGDVKARPGLEDLFNGARETFLDEARKLAKFNHPNIVRVNRYFEAHNTGYFVMDHEAGGSLRSLMHQNTGMFTEGEIEAIIFPLCRGLAELHHAALIHRDIKPDNIIIRPDGSPALIDFGAAVDLRKLSQAEPEVIATPAYAPIEQYIPSAPQGPWVDLYALGAVMYELIAGKPPTPSLKRIQGQEIEKAAVLGSGRYSDRLLGLIDKCLELNLQHRPQTTTEFLALLHMNQDHLLEGIINGASHRMIDHFANWATPNMGLYVDEFVAFAISFPIIDLSWRLGKGTPDKATFSRLLRLMEPRSIQACWEQLRQKGFRAMRQELTLQLIQARLDEYASTYLLDRQQVEWRYEMTCRQVARHCISASYSADISDFAELLESVIDRARGRVKKELNKAFRNTIWRKTDQGWVQEIVRFADDG